MRQNYGCLLFLLVILFSFNKANAQQYFQQQVNYNINVSLDDKRNTLTASEEIEYINNSPDTLKELWFHLWPNAYKNDSTALNKQMLEQKDVSLFFAKEASRGFIDSLDFKSEGQSIRFEYHSKHIDICKLILNKPLFPGEKIIISTPFFVKLPSANFSRLGHIDQAYSISQWYPKPAVYDQYGWHEMAYLDQGEFYSEFGTFDVKITLPKNYIVGATGDLVDSPAEEYWMNQLAEKTENVAEIKKDLSFPPSSNQLKTLHFHQEKVHDFAWFADKRFHVAKGEVTLARSGKKVTTWALFTSNQYKLWKQAIGYVNDALTYYSDWIGDYPYNQCTIVDGTIAAGAGMEYPNVSIIGQSYNSFMLQFTIVHEVGHNWFYGMLGSNEREHPWMDEGMNSFYEQRTILKKYAASNSKNLNDLTGLGLISTLTGFSKLNYREADDLVYKVSASSYSDQAIDRPSEEYKLINYGTIVYKKTALVLSQLNSYLGDSLFDACMQEYFRQWSFHHPYPNDFAKIVRNKTGEQLNWFFDDLISTDKKMDFAITGIKSNANGYTLKLKQRKDINAPIPVSGLKDGKTIFKKWVSSPEKNFTVDVPCKECNLIAIDHDIETIDLRRQNNQIRTHGLLKQLEPVRINFAAHDEYPARTRLFILPAVGINNYDKFMAGAIIHNIFVPYRKLEFSLIPLYSFNNKSFSGTGFATYHFYPSSGLFNNIDLSVNYKRFGYTNGSIYENDNYKENDILRYQRIEPLLKFNIRKNNLRSSLYQKVVLSLINLDVDSIFFDRGIITSSQKKTRNAQIGRLRYQLENSSILDPFSADLNIEGNDKFSKASATFNYKFSYSNSSKGVNIRLFAGIMFNDHANSQYGFSLSDRRAIEGTKDYAFDDWYLGRSEGEGFLSKQIMLRDGAFKIYNPYGSYKKQMASINLTIDLPSLIPISLFADLGTYNKIKEETESSLMYDAGICINLMPDVIQVFIPIFKSDVIKEYQKTNDINFGEQIRFVYNIGKTNLLTIRDQFTR